MVAHPGPQAAGRPTVPVTILRVEWPAGHHCRHPVPIPRASAAMRVISRQAVAGFVKAGRQPIRPGNRGVLPLATVIASVNFPRCLAEHVTKHLPARNHPTCDCCHDLLHRAAPVAVARPTGGLVVRADSRTCARAEMSSIHMHIYAHRNILIRSSDVASDHYASFPAVLIGNPVG